jgi:hypothetical protein
MTAHVSPDPRHRRSREVAERGVVHGRMVWTLPVITYGVRLTSLLIASHGCKATWYEARGHQPYLLDDALLHQIVQVTWERYEGSSRRYVTGRVLVRPPQPPGASRG